jgi:glycosyltransferase involved in cell wall biosynthesis
MTNKAPQRIEEYAQKHSHTLNSPRLVSVIIIFLNARQFLEEAIASVLAQTNPDWELLLVDDGSTDESAAIALRYAAEYPANIRYLEHSNHQNRGKSLSRNLGIAHARGEYIAFLDADDIWLPHKLEQQVALLEVHPEAGMIYGLDRYRYSWTGRSDDERDFIHPLGVSPNCVIEPPKLFVQFFLRQEAAIPCPTNILVRRAVFERVGGFEAAFHGIFNIYEDQAFYAKVTLATPVFASDTCWSKYRQHPESSCAVAQQSGEGR